MTSSSASPRTATSSRSRWSGSNLCRSWVRVGAHVADREEGAALGADAAVVDLPAAIAVPEDHRPRVEAVDVLVAPVQQRHDRRPEVEPLLGQPVLEALRALLVADPLEHPGVDELAEPVGEHVPGEAEVPLEDVEPLRPEERLADDEEGPALADDLEGRGQRAVEVLVGAGKHTPSVAEVVASSNSLLIACV